jgi:hypothetical protein
MIVWSLRFAARPAIVLIAGLAAVSAPHLARAQTQSQGKVDARYAVTLAGVPIGPAAHGAIAGGQPVPARFSSSVTSDRRTEEIRMTLNAAAVRDFAIDPPSPPNPERVPVTDAHRRGVSDPMTAALMRVPGVGDPLVPEACNRKLSIFDGRMRFDLQMAFKRMDQVRADKGYEGRAVVCAVYFSPVAGHIPDRAAIKYLTDQRSIEVWLVPIAGTRLLVPFRVAVPTPLGLGVLQATQFLSTAAPQRSSGSSTQ